MPRILVIGGVGEARVAAERLAQALSGARGVVIYALAGATRRPAAPEGAHLHSGGFGGVEGLARFLIEERITRVLDATHPFAARISRSAVEAASRAGAPLARLERPPWPIAPEWRVASDLAAAAEAPLAGERVFLALGRRGASAFAERRDLWRAARVAEPGVAMEGVDHLEIGPPGDAAAEAALFEKLRIDRLVARNSGGSIGRGKLDAAAALGIGVILVARPTKPPAPNFATVAEAVAWCLDAEPRR